MVRYISQVAMKYDTPIDNVGVLQIMHGIKFTYSLTYSLTHSLTHSLTYSLTYSLTHYFIYLGLQRLDLTNSDVKGLVAVIKENIASNSPESLQIIRENMEKIVAADQSMAAVHRALSE